MKKLLVGLILFGTTMTYAAEIKYSCVNKTIDADASYYLPKYLVTIDTNEKKATFLSENNEEVSEGKVAYSETQTKNVRLAGSVKGKMWSDSGCAVDFYLTKEMLSELNKAFMKVKAEYECRGAGVWLACFKL